ncbi:sorting nexin Snx41 [Schizosaccharomyces japonicus yFS275]|uniref:Sorting nexin Snx41 n=1 Tax=Schizosaccharomyces japonicus (strain yFS275 / FY16936) TaxID=402676 RepID=B6K1C7_SCHJY|nr:sorting nexin Snx41 [Schizosaccharomyces japonicus yFS275]EEB07748.2 sorting nexin Snx41 [Schizosaccharomyces japonicus yFS275]
MDSFEDNNPFSGTRFIKDDELPEEADTFNATWDDVKPASTSSSAFINNTERTSGLEISKNDHVEEEYPSSKPLPNPRPFMILPVQVTGALKAKDGSHIVYSIKTDSSATQRRYSEFVSLRINLGRLYPTCVVPPLPEKHSIVDYVFSFTKTQRNNHILEQRKRMLQTFLLNVYQHPVLGQSQVFRDFLSRNVSWNEVLANPPISLLPKNILKASPRDPASQEEMDIYTHLPVPSVNLLPKNAYDAESQYFIQQEEDLKTLSQHLANHVSRSNNQLLSTYTRLSSLFSELGAELNALSLPESGLLLACLERTGQACDRSCFSAVDLIHMLIVGVSEPLMELSKFASTMRLVLQYKRIKTIQCVLANDMLSRKTELLELLEQRESEANRLSLAIQETETDPVSLRAQSEESSSGGTSDERPLGFLSPMQHFESNFANDLQDPYLSSSGLNTSGFGPASDEGFAAHDSYEEQSHQQEEQDTNEPPPDDAEGAANTVTNENATLPADDSSNSPKQKTPTSRIAQTIAEFFDKINFAIHGLVDVDNVSTRHSTIGRTKESVAQLERMVKVTKQDAEFADKTVSHEYKRYAENRAETLRSVYSSFATAHENWAKCNLEFWSALSEQMEREATIH